MSSPVQKPKAPRAEDKKSEKKADDQATKKAAAPRTAKAKDAEPPAYMQAKLAVSDPGDSAEKEADSVARQVAHTEKTEGKEMRRAGPALAPADEETSALEPVAAARNIQRRPEPAAVMPASKQEISDKDSKPTIQRDASDGSMAGAPVAGETESRIEACRGTGAPLEDSVKTAMESQFGRDFGSVRIHTDGEAADLCAEIGARAFTVGNDIFFAPGEYAPGSDDGRELLAHELTHVVQQGAGVQQKIQRTPTPPSAGSPAAPAATPALRAQAQGATLTGTVLSHPDKGSMDRSAHLITLKSIDLPAVKKPFTPAPFDIPAGRTREDTQSSQWNTAVAGGATHMQSKLQQKLEGAPDLEVRGQPVFYLKLKREEQFVMGTREQILSQLNRPLWNRNGQQRSYDVDHKKEFQLGGGDDIDNYWLLEASANRSSGAKINNELNRKIEAILAIGRQVWSPSQVRSSAENARGGDTIRVEAQGANMSVAGHPDDHWELGQITQGNPLDALDVLNEGAIRRRNLQGSPRRIAIYSNENGGRPAFIDWGEGVERVQLGRDPGWGFTGRDAEAGIRVTEVNYQQVGSGDPSGTVTGFAYSRNKYLQGMPFTWNIVPMSGVQYGGAISNASVESWVRQRLRAKGFSPVEIEAGHLEPGSGLVAQGKIISDLPMLRDAELALTIDGSRVEMSASLPVEAVKLPSPITVTYCSIRVFAGTDGFGAEGAAGVEIRNLGSGEVSVGVSSELGFNAEGKFSFDSKLFDRADLDIWYRRGQFGGSGELGIDSPDKIRGIRSANITARFEEQNFSAEGSVQPDIPGIQQAGLSLQYSEQAGLTIGGNLQLTANPAIRSGSIDVTVRKMDEEWKVAATGTAQPAIPGINSQLTVSYDDGAFTAEFSGAFARGMLSGNATVGATNRAVGADGRPSGEAAPNAPLVVYGSGSATIQIAPWLQGTAGIRFAPNGEVTVSGEIGLPNSLEIFSIKEINKQLFGLSTQIPIFPGIVAEVGGNLSAHASIGPGALDQCRIGIEYNPSHEENTHVTGDAHLNIPAEAGLRLAARAGIGLGITGASATGGLELGGTLGIGGAAEAGVHIDWTPGSGLAIDAEGYLHASPRFKFDVSGYVAVTALGFSVYDNSWQLAAYELGSDLTFGVRFPIHYREGQPFDVSLDDVRFEVPDVDPAALVRQLGDHIFA